MGEDDSIYRLARILNTALLLVITTSSRAGPHSIFRVTFLCSLDCSDSIIQIRVGP